MPARRSPHRKGTDPWQDGRPLSPGSASGWAVSSGSPTSGMFATFNRTVSGRPKESSDCFATSSTPPSCAVPSPGPHGRGGEPSRRVLAHRGRALTSTRNREAALERNRRDVLATAVVLLALAACAADAGASLPAKPWEVTSFVRITASATRGLPWPDPSQPLDLGGVEGGCVTIRVAPDGDFQVAGPSLWARAVPGPQPRVRSSSRMREGTGVIESFYGVPWSSGERKALLRSMAAMGMDTNIYAPKHDPFHRGRWREAYPATFEAAFADMAALGRELGVRVVFGLSPFIDMDLDDVADYAVARDKHRRFLDLGQPAWNWGPTTPTSRIGSRPTRPCCSGCRRSWMAPGADGFLRIAYWRRPLMP